MSVKLGMAASSMTQLSAAVTAVSGVYLKISTQLSVVLEPGCQAGSDTANT